MDSQPLIVLAEDNPVIRTLMADVLTDEGYRVIPCASGAQAIDVLAMDDPDLIILDMHMEQPDAGLQVLRSMRQGEGTKELPAIVYSADNFALRAHHWEFIRHNAVTIGKPFELGLLLDTVDDLIRAGPR